MTPQNIFKTISERLQTAATVKTVYGDPVVAEGKTIIPVARVRFGFGAGFGEGDTGGEGVSGNAEADKGGGGGGGVEVRPVGFIEITPGETRYVSIEGRRTAARLAFLGLLAAFLLLMRRSKRVEPKAK
ncbi:MAG: hypothetical protein J4O08_10105 [Chloroflexi bacterium]|nr:hypothetical protein [Chloroflexota bacterium]